LNPSEEENTASSTPSAPAQDAKPVANTVDDVGAAFDELFND
jgi:hypothetical protein